jgi:hypothetical protein
MTGCLQHDNATFTIYRVFENIVDGANFSIYVLLKRLELWRANHHGRFPTTVYWQVDGGSENANRFCLAICELLIARTPIEEIIFTRLPVGHTHEDIDGKILYF